MNTLRIICTENDFGEAAHVGGPAQVTLKTFDVPCPPELAAWLRAEGKDGKWVHRWIQGVEVFAADIPEEIQDLEVSHAD